MRNRPAPRARGAFRVPSDGLGSCIIVLCPARGMGWPKGRSIGQSPSAAVAFLFQGVKGSLDLLQKNTYAGEAAAIRMPQLTAAPRSRVRHASVVALASIVALLSLVPLGFIVWITIDTGWAEVSALIFRSRVGDLLVNTVLLEVCTIPLSILLAVTLAWLTERTDIPCARLWSWQCADAFQGPRYRAASGRHHPPSNDR